MSWSSEHFTKDKVDMGSTKKVFKRFKSKSIQFEANREVKRKVLIFCLPFK
jgi:hypothetical protein